jgi:hypothetical protein
VQNLVPTLYETQHPKRARPKLKERTRIKVYSTTHARKPTSEGSEWRADGENEKLQAAFLTTWMHGRMQTQTGILVMSVMIEPVVRGLLWNTGRTSIESIPRSGPRFPPASVWESM